MQAKQLQHDLRQLPLKMMLAAGFVTYLAKTPEDVRAAMLVRWQALVVQQMGNQDNQALTAGTVH